MFPNRQQYDGMDHHLGKQQYPIMGGSNDVDDKMEDSLNSSSKGNKDKRSSTSSLSSPQPPLSKKGKTATVIKKTPEKKKPTKQKAMKEPQDDVVDPKNPPIPPRPPRTDTAAAAAVSRRGGVGLDVVADSAAGVGLIGGKNPPRMTSVDDSTMLPEW